MLCSIRGELGSACDLPALHNSTDYGEQRERLTYWLWSTGVDGSALLLPLLSGE
jgi:hypothetical protein